MLKKTWFLLLALAITGIIFLFWVSFQGKNKTSYQVKISSLGNFTSQQMPAVDIAILGNGAVLLEQLAGNKYSLSSDITWNFTQDKITKTDMAQALHQLMMDPIEISLDENGQAKYIYFSHSLDPIQAEIALNLWRMMINAIFIPRVAEKDFLGTDLWGPAGWQKTCESDSCSIKGLSLLHPKEFKLTGESKTSWKGAAKSPESLSTIQKNRIQHILFQSETVNELVFQEEAMSSAKKIARNPLLTQYSAQLETDGLRNKIRVLRAQYKDHSIENFLSAIKKLRVNKDKNTQIYQLIETALLLFPEHTDKIAELHSKNSVGPKIKEIILSAIVKSPMPKAQNFLRSWILQPDFKPYLTPALFTLTFLPTSSPDWKNTLEQLGQKYPEFKNTAELMVCSLARVLADKKMAENRFAMPLDSPLEILSQNIQCLGNTGFLEALPLLEKCLAHKNQPIKEDALFALRFIRDDKILALYKAAANDPSLHSAILRSLDARINHGIRDNGIEIFLENFPREKNRPDLEKIQLHLLDELRR